tara:strand:- start:550 stop:840 length:291 start_codon:yes stop_codon:yes gene_type:complete
MKKTKQTKQKKRMILNMSKKKYTKLVRQKKNKKKMSLKNKKQLDHALFIQYCKCLKKFKFSNNESLGYPVCMNSIYKNRGFKAPKNISRLCNEKFN